MNFCHKWSGQGCYRTDHHGDGVHPFPSKFGSNHPGGDLTHQVAPEERAEDRALGRLVPIEGTALNLKKKHIKMYFQVY